jgi:hypothetical protein
LLSSCINKVDEANRLVTVVANLLLSSTLSQGDNNLFKTCRNNWEQLV